HLVLADVGGAVSVVAEGQQKLRGRGRLQQPELVPAVIVALGVAAVVRRRIELVGEPEAGLDDRELDVARAAAGIAPSGNDARPALAADRGLLIRREVGPEGRCAAGDEDESGEQ